MRRFLALILLFCYPPLFAAETQSLDELVEQVESYLQTTVTADLEDVEITVTKPDSRLTLPHCPEPLELGLTQQNKKYGRLSVTVKCGGEKPWSLYVQANINAYGKILVAAQNVQRGTIIMPQHLRWDRRNIAKIRGESAQSEQLLLGKELTRTVKVGTPILPSMLRLPILVHKGEQVTIRAGSDSFSITMSGVAEGDGAMGDTITVKNISSGKKVDAIVTGAGRVKIPM